MSKLAVPNKIQLSRDEFIAFQALSENSDKRFEFIDGDLVEVTPPHIVTVGLCIYWSNG